MPISDFRNLYQRYKWISVLSAIIRPKESVSNFYWFG